ncbi:MAG TPA: MlaD family protein [Mycobacteriales bacterium]|jgi:phospholipid/cholesterol/gamma-HCH transport system substrate-binding protein|nr:MlaD family protein [Mycobacteriales bacterium]
MRGQTLGAAVKLIIFALVTIVATALLGVVISNRTFGATYTYKANVADVTDLITGSDVRMAGVRVGTVKSIKSMSVGANNFAQIAFTVDTDVPMMTTTKVEVQYLNLVGQRYIDLVPESGGVKLPQKNALIPESDTSPAVDLTALFNGFKPLFRALSPDDVNKFALEIIQTLQGEGGTIDSLLKQTASLTNTVAQRDAAIGQVIDNLLTVLGTVQHRDQGLGQTIDQLQRLVTGLAGDRDAISTSLTNIDDLATNSAKLFTGIRPSLPGDLRNLTQLAGNLNNTKDLVNKTENALAGFLKREPAKLNRITRTGSYGSYFNFWLCSATVGGLPVQLQPAASQSPSCPVAS